MTPIFIIDWSKVDWPDVGLHILGAIAIVAVAGVPVLILFPPSTGLVTFAAAVAATMIFWLREADQRKPFELRPWLWRWGAQMELYGPAIAAFVVALILTVIA